MSTRLIFEPESICRLWCDILGAQGALVAMLTATGVLAIDAPLVREVSLEFVLPVAADALQTSCLVFAAVFAIVSDFILGLANSWMTEAAVDIPRCGSPHRARCGSLG